MEKWDERQDGGGGGSPSPAYGYYLQSNPMIRPRYCSSDGSSPHQLFYGAMMALVLHIMIPNSLMMFLLGVSRAEVEACNTGRTSDSI